MVKTVWYVLLSLCLTACVHNEPGRFSASTKDSLKTAVESKCYAELKKNQNWQLIVSLLDEEKKLIWEQKVCSCVAEEAVENVSEQDLLNAAMNKQQRSEIGTEVMKKSVKACIKRIKL